MNVRTSKTFAQFVAKTLKKINPEHEAYIVNVSEREHELYCGIWSDPWMDYNSRTGEFNLIAIEYPWIMLQLDMSAQKN